VKQRIEAVVNGTTLADDGWSCGEDVTLHSRRFPNVAMARAWVDKHLTQPIPDGCVSMWGFITKYEYDNEYGTWEVVEESDTIGIGDTAPTKFFARTWM
jgi:hypothetical protein